MPEAQLQVKTLLSSVELEWAFESLIPLQLSPVESVIAKAKLAILLPRSMHPGTSQDQPDLGLPPCVKSLLLLHVEELELGLYDDDKAKSIEYYRASVGLGFTCFGRQLSC